MTKEEARSGDNAFKEPPAYEAAPVVWLARDHLGIGAAEVEDMQAKGVQASLQGAEMNEKGKVDVSRSPPVCFFPPLLCFLKRLKRVSPQDEEWFEPTGGPDGEENGYTSSPTATKTGNGLRDAGDAPRRFSTEPETPAPTRYEDATAGDHYPQPRSRPAGY